MSLAAWSFGCGPTYGVYLDGTFPPAVETESGGDVYEAATFVVVARRLTLGRPDSVRVEVFTPPHCREGGRPERSAFIGSVGWTPEAGYTLDRGGAAVLPYPSGVRATLHVRPFGPDDGTAPARHDLVTDAEDPDSWVDAVLVFFGGPRDPDCTVI